MKSQLKQFLLTSKSNIISNKGFSLVELLIVIVVMAILATVGIPTYNGYIAGARNKDAQIAIRAVAAAEESFRLFNGAYYPSGDSLTCEANATTSAAIANNLMAGTTLNTSHFYYCVSAINTAVPVSFKVKAVSKLNTTKIFTIDQNNATTGF